MVRFGDRQGAPGGHSNAHSDKSESEKQQGRSNAEGSYGTLAAVYGRSGHGFNLSGTTNTSVVGLVTALSSSTVTVNSSLSFPLASGAVIEENGHVATSSTATVPALGVLQINGAGDAVSVMLGKHSTKESQHQFEKEHLASLPSLDRMKHGLDVVSGVVSAVSPNSLTLGTTSVNLSSSTKIRYREYTLKASQIPTGVQAQALLAKTGSALQVNLASDPELPPKTTVVGIVYDTGSTVTVGAYHLTASAHIKIRYGDQKLKSAQAIQGARGRVHLDNRGTVAWIKILKYPAGANLNHSDRSHSKKRDK
jgi:hypothetical protein